MRIVRVSIVADYQLPKRDCSRDEPDDAWAWKERDDKYTLAVADGASQSAYACLWARLLVKRFVKKPTLDIDAAWVEPAARCFRKAIAAKRPLPWYVEGKLARGTFATLLGVVLDKDAPVLKAVAVGDSLLAWRTPSGQGTFPVTSLGDMPPYPFLVSTLKSCNANLPTQTARDRVQLPYGDTYLFLMTDALGRWYLRELHEGREPWRQLLDLKDQPAFARWAEDKREHGHLQNDDLTLIIVRVTVEGEQGSHATAQTG